MSVRIIHEVLSVQYTAQREQNLLAGVAVSHRLFVEDVVASIGAVLLDKAVAGALQLLGALVDWWRSRASQKLTALKVS